MLQKEIEKLTEEELEETTGGVAGYGNIQFECACGAKFLTQWKWVNHLRTQHHDHGTAYYQKASGKGNRGSQIGRVNVKYAPYSIILKYPNGAKEEYIK